MIKVTDLTIGWDGVALMEKLNFEIKRGDIFMILGGSGTGKSTLLRNMIGLNTPFSGTVEIEGVSHASLVGRRPWAGVLFQSGALFGSMTLGENVALPLQTWTKLDQRTIEQLVRTKLALVGLDGFENHMPAELSGGMRKRGGIARALALEPPLIFLDEPSAGLDPINMAELDELILTLSEAIGMTVVVVTHELASIFRVGTSCILLDSDAKNIIARGDPNELRKTSTHPAVKAFFHRQTLELLEENSA